MLALSEGAWQFLGLLVINLFGFATLIWKARSARTSIEQINRAVNHQSADEPTLVERVIAVEHSQQVAIMHRTWERDAFRTLATHVGCHLPPYPNSKEH